MEQPSILRETKGLQQGFVKEDVLTYLDELNSKILSLENELKEKSGQKPADPQELVKYRTQVDNLQEKLNASNNALRAAKKENDELLKQIEKMKAGGGAVVENPQTKAALESAKKEIETLRVQLKNAASVQGNSGQAQAAVEAAKKEIDKLRTQLKEANQKVSAAQQKAADAERKSASAPAASENPAAAAELAKTKQEIVKLTAELKSKAAELDAVNKESAAKDTTLAKLSKESEAAAKKDAEIASLNTEIANLNKEITELRNNANNPAAMMGSLFTEAQKTVNNLKAQAEKEAAETTKAAEEKAAAVISEANATAEKTVVEANAAAQKTVSEANAAAEKTVSEANAQAKAAVDDANSKAGKINEMSSTVRSMLLNEIEGVNRKFMELSETIQNLTGQASERMTEAQTIIGEAKKAVEPNDSNTVKLAEAPKADFTAAKTAPKAEAPKADVLDSSDPFANLTGGSYNKGVSPANFNSSKPAAKSAPAPAPAPAPEAPKPAAKKPVSSFNFDMSDLLKAAEEEAAKGQ